jgi:hypothetical protein
MRPINAGMESTKKREVSIMSNKADLKGMNVLIFITDQQRATQHFPPHRAEQNLPGLTRLKRRSLTFERAFCDSCMCSPSRATLMTGYFPAQHGVKWTLEESMPDDHTPNRCSRPTFPTWEPDGCGGVCDALQRQVPPDSAGYPNEFGDGNADNDSRGHQTALLSDRVPC